MKGNLRDSVKKWWVLVLVATLALSLTSCGKKKTSLMSGALECSGDLGDFDVATVSVGTNQYELIVVPYEAYADELYFFLRANETGPAQQIGAIEVAGNSQEYALNIFSKVTLSQFPLLEIFDPASQRNLICEIPLN